MFFIIVAFSFQSVVSFCGTIEDIKEELGQETKTKVETRKLFDIQSVYKDSIDGCDWDDALGTGPILAITVRFKIWEDGKNISIPYLLVYLYDRDYNLVKKIDTCLEKTTVRSELLYKGSTFEGKKTYQLQFPYRVSDEFMYAVAIVGSDQECSAEVLPQSAVISDFSFPEKYIVQNTSK